VIVAFFLLVRICKEIISFCMLVVVLYCRWICLFVVLTCGIRVQGSVEQAIDGGVNYSA
jgi:predicted secreted protein